MIALTRLLIRDAHSPQAHRSTMCQRANRHISDRIRYWRVDMCASMLRSPLERDGPLLWPLRTGRGALHAHARARASTGGRPLPKLRGKRVRHGRMRESRSAGAHRSASLRNRPRTAPLSRRAGALGPAAITGHPGTSLHTRITLRVPVLSVAGLESWLTGGIMATRGARCEIGGDRRAGVRRTAQEKCPSRAC